MTTKRSRGRPKGTAMNDGPHLDTVADLMVRNPSLKKTPAIAEIVQNEFPEHKWQATERRLLRKWNETACERLESAAQRLQGERSTRVVRRARRSSNLFPEMSGVMTDAVRFQSIYKDMQDLIDPPAMRSIHKQIKVWENFRDIVDPPVLRRIREQTEMMRKAFRPLNLL